MVHRKWYSHKICMTSYPGCQTSMRIPGHIFPCKSEGQFIFVRWVMFISIFIQEINECENN